MRIALGAGGSGLGGLRFNQRVVSGLEERLGDDLDVVRVASLRADAPDATRRLPMSSFDKRALGTMRAFGAAYWGNKPLHRMDIRLPPARNEIVSVLDFAPLHYDDEGSIPDWVIPSIQQCRGALCLSPSVAEEVQALADIPTWVTGAGIDERFFDAQPLGEEALLALGISGPFALSVGGTTKRKNLQLLVDSWPLVHRETQLTLVSLGPNAERRRALFAATPGVVVLGELPDALLPKVLSAAHLLVLPSLYEGFGLPLVEAMATGTPTVAVARSSLPWVGADAVMSVEPEPAAFAAGVLTVSLDAEIRHSLVSAAEQRRSAFSWESVVTRHVIAYSEAFGLT